MDNKINFYCNVVDDQMRHEGDNPTIGLILCQDKKRVLAEYALRRMESLKDILGRWRPSGAIRK